MLSLQIAIPRPSPLPSAFGQTHVPASAWRLMRHDSPPAEDGVPIEGLPAFATSGWFAANVRVSPTLFRRIRDALAKRRRLEPDFLPHWETAGITTAADMPRLVAAIAPDVRTTHEFFVLVSSVTAGWKSMHSGIFSTSAQDVVNDHATADVRRRDHALSCLLAACGSQALSGDLAAHVLADFVSDPLRPSWYAVLTDWYLDRHPKAFPKAERVLAKREAAASTSADVPQPPTSEPIAASPEAPVAGDVADDDPETTNGPSPASGPTSDAPSTPAVREDELPSSAEDLLGWIGREMPATVQVLPRAIRSLRKTADADWRRIASALRFLRDVYVPARREARTHSEAYRTALAETGFVESASFGTPAVIRSFPEYRARWAGRTVWLDRHLKRGVARDPRRLIRIYFHWCDETETVVVGHLPGHLPSVKG